MRILKFNDSKNLYTIKDDTMNESLLQKTSSYPIYLRDSKIYSNRVFISKDDGSQNVTLWLFLYKR